MESDARASLISDITSAFAGVRLGGGVGLFEAQGLDDYADVAERKALRERDEKDAWTVFSADALNCANSSLSFFDAERMRFHLRAYLVADLRGDYKFGVVFTLCQASVRDERPDRHREHRVRGVHGGLSEADAVVVAESAPVHRSACPRRDCRCATRERSFARNGF